jgi:hypothetical protein
MDVLCLDKTVECQWYGMRDNATHRVPVPTFLLLRYDDDVLLFSTGRVSLLVLQQYLSDSTLR